MNELANLFVWRRDGVVVTALTGELDVSNAGDLETAIAGEVGDAAGVVMDLTGLTFMDSSGVHLLFHLASRLAVGGLGFAVVLPETSLPRRVLEMSGTRPATWIHATEDEAVAAVLGAS